MSWLPATLGLMLGCGILVGWQGFRAATDKTLAEAERKKGLWKLNGGIALAAVSMIAILHAAPTG